MNCRGGGQRREAGRFFFLSPLAARARCSRRRRRRRCFAPSRATAPTPRTPWLIHKRGAHNAFFIHTLPYQPHGHLSSSTLTLGRGLATCLSAAAAVRAPASSRARRPAPSRTGVSTMLALAASPGRDQGQGRPEGEGDGASSQAPMYFFFFQWVREGGGWSNAAWAVVNWARNRVRQEAGRSGTGLMVSSTEKGPTWGVHGVCGERGKRRVCFVPRRGARVSRERRPFSLSTFSTC